MQARSIVIRVRRGVGTGRRLAGRLVRGLRRRIHRRIERYGTGSAARTRRSAASRAPKVAPAEQSQASKPKPVPELRTALRSLCWSPDGSLELAGWAYPAGLDLDHGSSDLSLWLEPLAAADAERVPIPVTRGHQAAVDVAADDPYRDHADGWFTATIPAGRLPTEPGQWRFRIELRQGEYARTGGFERRTATGSAGLSVTRQLDEYSFARPVWSPASGGLVLQVFRPEITAAVAATDDGLAVEVRGAAPSVSVGVVGEQGEPLPGCSLTAVPSGNGGAALRGLIRTAVLADLPTDFCGTLVAVDATGGQVPIRARSTAVGSRLTVTGHADITLTVATDGSWQLSRSRQWARLEDVHLDCSGNRLVVAGVVYPASDWRTAELSGQREIWSAPIEVRSDQGTTDVGRFSARIDLLGTDRWGNPALAPLGGRYQLAVSGSDAIALIPQLGADLAARLPERTCTDRLSCQLERNTDDTLRVTIGAALPDTERGKRHQALLQAWSRRLDAPVVDAVYFESFAGKFAACSPRAIFDRLHALSPELPCYWGIRDAAVPVPDGAVPVLMQSREWWRIRTTSRFLVTNAWVQSTFDKRPGQQVLQTWHGTPYKRLALDREGQSKGFVNAVRAESAKWDQLAVQSDYMAEVMASAYGYRGPILRSGYPRNDIVSRPEGALVRRALRDRLGIAEDQQCLLYAPTWRDDRSTMVDELDLVELSRRLGEGYVVLARGHGNVLRRDHDHSGSGVIDVTSYPDVTHLFLAADLAITDYSSVMFDYTAGGKPLLFFVPDLERYTSSLRGAYFDLAELAPGPLLTSLDQVVEAVHDIDDLQRAHHARYQQWQQRFNSWDDGGATDRVIQAVFADVTPVRAAEVTSAMAAGGSPA